MVDLTAETIPFGVRLTWNPPADDDVQGYYVWQSTTDPDTGETVWTKNCWEGTSLSATELLCPTLPDGGTHVYRVAATDAQYSDEDIDFFQTAEVSVTLPDTRPPGWTGTAIREDQYPELYVGCSESSGLGDCSLLTDYRVERWDPVTNSYVTLTTGKVARRASSWTPPSTRTDSACTTTARCTPGRRGPNWSAGPWPTASGTPGSEAPRRRAQINLATTPEELTALLHHFRTTMRPVPSPDRRRLYLPFDDVDDRRRSGLKDRMYPARRTTAAASTALVLATAGGLLTA